jgi:hypothetical protein
MQVETKFLRLFREVAIGDHIDGASAGLGIGQMPGAVRGDGRETHLG